MTSSSWRNRVLEMGVSLPALLMVVIGPAPAMAQAGEDEAPTPVSAEKPGPKKKTAVSKYDPFDLALGRIPVRNLDQATDEVTFKVEDKALEVVSCPAAEVVGTDESQTMKRRKKGCPSFWESRHLRSYIVHFGGKRAEIVPRKMSGPAVTSEVERRKGVLQLPRGWDEVAIRVTRGGRSFWAPATRDDQTVKMDIFEIELSEPILIYVRAKGGSDGAYYRIPALDTGPKETPSRPEVFCDKRDQRKLHKDYPNAEIFCAKVEKGSAPQIIRMPRLGLVVRPNHTIAVVIEHPPSVTNVTGSLDGEVGLSELKIRRDSAGVAQAGTKTDGTPVPKVTVLQFAPRRPGNLELTIQADGRTTTTEIIVESTFAGAFRLGVALLGGGAVERGYAAQAPPGGTQPEIVSVTGGPVDLEVVAGFALYPEAFSGGRSSVTRDSCLVTKLCLSPFVGFGFVGRDDQGDVELFKALYVGVEAELTPNFGFAVAGVARRVNRLSAGLDIGQPVNPGEVPTQEGVELGWALLFNLSPDLFRLGTTSGSDLIGGAQ